MLSLLCPNAVKLSDSSLEGTLIPFKSLSNSLSLVRSKRLSKTFCCCVSTLAMLNRVSGFGVWMSISVSLLICSCKSLNSFA